MNTQGKPLEQGRTRLTVKDTPTARLTRDSVASQYLLGKSTCTGTSKGEAQHRCRPRATASIQSCMRAAAGARPQSTAWPAPACCPGPARAALDLCPVRRHRTTLGAALLPSLNPMLHATPSPHCACWYAPPPGPPAHRRPVPTFGVRVAEGPPPLLWI